MIVEIKKKITNPNGSITIMMEPVSGGAWVKTHTGPDYRNWKHWKDFSVGDVITNIKPKDVKKRLADADVPPRYYEPEE